MQEEKKDDEMSDRQNRTQNKNENKYLHLSDFSIQKASDGR